MALKRSQSVEKYECCLNFIHEDIVLQFHMPKSAKRHLNEFFPLTKDFLRLKLHNLKSHLCYYHSVELSLTI